MASSRAVLFVILLASCRGVQSVRLDPTMPVATIANPERARTEAQKLFDAQPRNLERVRHAALQLEKVAASLRDDYDAQWQAARAFAFVAEHEVKTAARKEAAQRGMALAKRARELQADRVEGHYWYAINVGMLADADHAYGLSAVDEIKSVMERAREIDERFDFAGPLRVLGVLLLRTPGPPLSVGSPRKGLRLLERAAELFPEYPENFLYLAEALRDNHRAEEAKVALAKVIDSKPWPDRQLESSQWKADAEKLRQKLPKS